MGEHEGKDYYRYERIQQSPQEAEDRSLVSDFQVARDEHLYQFSVLPKLSEPCHSGAALRDWRIQVGGHIDDISGLGIVFRGRREPS
jgi:hypothetical protein